MEIFGGLRRRIERIQRNIREYREYDVEERMEHATMRMQEMVLLAMERHAPDGSQNLDEYVSTDRRFSRQGQRPSRDRFDAIPIKEGLSVEVGSFESYDDEEAILERTVYQRQLSITTRSPHTKFFTTGLGTDKQWIGGTTPHMIPSAWVKYGIKRPLAYHIPGLPLGVEVWTAVGPQSIDLEKHGDFVKEAWESVRDDVDREFETAMTTSLLGLGKALFK